MITVEIFGKVFTLAEILIYLDLALLANQVVWATDFFRDWLKARKREAKKNNEDN